jgi:hypothetical protein
MDDKLKDIFGNINEWLKFAEAKNGALLGINAAVITTLLSNLDKIKLYWIIETVLLNVFLPSAIISTLIALKSFWPARKHELISTPASNPLADDNLLFFGHIKNYSPSSYLTNLEVAIGNTPEGNFTRLQIDYAKQIITNAKIANRKYTLFNLGVVVDVIGVGLSFIVSIYLILFKSNIFS